MTIAQYLRLLRDQWMLVLLLTVLGGVGAGVFSVLSTPVYQAHAQLFVSTSGQSGSLGELTQGSTFTQQRVKSYTDLLTSPKVLEPVIRTLDLETTAGALAGRITATSPLDTVLINVTVDDDSPTRAADIANAIAVQFPRLVNELETRPGQTVSPVKVSITRPAVPSSVPVAPRTSLNLALGLLVGLGLGIGTAVLRDSLDRTVGGRHQASELAGAPVLGAVLDDPQASEAPLISHDAFSPRAEAYRQLRTNIRFLSVDHRVSSLVVTGSVQGEGKTTTAANIALALAQSGEQVVLIDADLRRPTVADLFGVPSGVGLTSVLLGDLSVESALQRWRDDVPLFLLTSGPLPPNPSELIGSSRMADIVHRLTERGMTVVVDSPPLLPVTDAAILSRVTDGALMVTHVASTKVDQFSTAIDALRTAGAPILGVVLNRVPKRGRASRGYEGYGGYGGYGTRYGSAPAPSAQALLAGAGTGAGAGAVEAMWLGEDDTNPTNFGPVPPVPRGGEAAVPPLLLAPAGFATASPYAGVPADATVPAGPPQGVVDLRQHADIGRLNGSVNGGLNGSLNGSVHGTFDEAIKGSLNGSAAGYPPPPKRPRGRRSATPTEPHD